MRKKPTFVISPEIVDFACEAKLIDGFDKGTMLIDTIIKTRELLQNLPNEFEFEFSKEFSPEKLGTTSSEIFLNLNREVYSSLGFFLFDAVYKVSQTLHALVENLNRARYIPALVLARVLFEQIAFFNYGYMKLEPKLVDLRDAYIKIQKRGASLEEKEGKELDVKFVSTLVEIRTECISSTIRMRFDWRSATQGKLGEDWRYVEGPNLKKIRQRLPDYKNVEIAYSLLSECVHPGTGQSFFVIKSTQTLNDKIKYRLSKEPESSELLYSFFWFTGEPIAYILNVFGSTVEKILPALEFFKGFIEFCETSNAKIDDF